MHNLIKLQKHACIFAIRVRIRVRIKIKVQNFKIKAEKIILSKVYAWKWPTQYITEWLSKKQRENEIFKILSLKKLMCKNQS